MKQILTEGFLMIMQPICLVFLAEEYFELETLDNIGWGVVALFGGLLGFHLTVMI